MRPDADAVVCVASPPKFSAIGQFYADFSQITDAEVTDLLQRAADATA
jgi:predicted phosphoribosyltransferase